ncbi:lysophospholipid acyltransferase family protein [Mycoplasmopsis gallinacea]|uniref:lysophospholipid acyltransferase family protein n=1 Tax=Mycoplasmopsis gallinacea TaxID=29556 RepID=UPI001E511FB3|nr:lysophospholipid acyltransferase family protein [Mycoplasmopsis gallinacea]
MKLTIKPIFKKILFVFPWLNRLRRIFSLSRKYRKTPENVPAQLRNDFLSKLSRKILDIYNVDLEVFGADNLPSSGNVMLVPNHKSNADSLAIMAALWKVQDDPNKERKVPTFLAKKELLDWRILRNALSLNDAFAIDRSNFRESLEVLKEFSAFVKENKTYGVIFPEGTRVKGKELGKFNSGAFKVAKNDYYTIVPVAINGSETVFNKGRKGRLKVVVSFLNPLKPIAYMTQDPKAVAERVRKLIQEEIDKNE